MEDRATWRSLAFRASRFQSPRMVEILRQVVAEFGHLMVSAGEVLVLELVGLAGDAADQGADPRGVVGRRTEQNVLFDGRVVSALGEWNHAKGQRLATAGHCERVKPDADIDET